MSFLKELAETFAEENENEDVIERRSPSNPTVEAIAATLNANPLLVVPTLRFIQQKQSEVAEATLVVLYGREEYEAMKARELANQRTAQ